MDWGSGFRLYYARGLDLEFFVVGLYRGVFNGGFGVRSRIWGSLGLGFAVWAIILSVAATLGNCRISSFAARFCVYLFLLVYLFSLCCPECDYVVAIGVWDVFLATMFLANIVLTAFLI